ncbi:NAD-dependent epimerase/dehydratase family protein [bacterium]|nr:MAG: NAD-dependent epimerase/dehydratase family protein [bacterium]
MASSNFWRDRTVFITGATGLLGGHLTTRLIELGANIVALTRDWRPETVFARDNLAARTTLVHGDVCNGELLKRILAEYEVQTVFHLAAQTLVGPANADPATTFEVNIAGSWRLFEAARSLPKPPQIVLASSDKAYGEQEVLPYREDARLEGRQPYAVSKSCADLIAQTYAATYGLPVAITRCGNFYGGGDLNWNRIVPGTIRSAFRGECPIIRSDGSHLRDYIYVKDGVSAYLALGEAMASNSALAGEAFNFGHNEPVSVLNLVTAILKACGREDLVPDVRNEAKHEIINQSLDASKASEVLGWTPGYGLDAGLSETVKWYREFLGESGS